MTGDINGFTVSQLHELKRQIELFQEVNNHVRSILENTRSNTSIINNGKAVKDRQKRNSAEPAKGVGRPRCVCWALCSLATVCMKLTLASSCEI